MRRSNALSDAPVIARGANSLGQPTHGVLVDGAFYFLANTGWDRFGDDGAIKGAGTPARLVRVDEH